MATSRPFAYNTGSSIAGTEQVGDLAIGFPTGGFASTGVQWWNGPDEDLGYVVTHTTPSGTQPTPDEVGAYIGFWRSKVKNESSFIQLAEYIASKNEDPQTFLTGNSAKTWLNFNGFWTSYTTGGSSTGDYYLISQYTPAINKGEITFPNHNAETFSLNPNLVGQSGYALYINKNDAVNTSQTSVLDNLLGQSGTLTLTQGSNSVTYSFTSTAFSFGLGNSQYYWDNTMESSPLGGITLLTSASGNFDTTTPITITITN